MSAATAAFLRSGRRVRATVAPPTTVNRVCYWRRNLIELRTLGPANLASATGYGHPTSPDEGRHQFQSSPDNDRLAYNSGWIEDATAMDFIAGSAAM